MTWRLNAWAECDECGGSVAYQPVAGYDPATDDGDNDGLGDWPTYFVESIPGGWCVVNGEQATTRIAEQIKQSEQGMTPEEDMMNLPDGWTCGLAGDWRGPDGASAAVDRVGVSFMAIMYAPARGDAESARVDLVKMVAGLDGYDTRAEITRLKDALQHVTHALADTAKPGETPERTIANLIADRDRAHQQRDTADRQQADTFDALIAERKTSSNLRAEVRRLQEHGVLKRLLRRVVG